MNRQQRRAAARRGQSPAFYANHGLALQNLGRLDEAVSSYDRAIALDPNLFEVHYNRANALRDLGLLEDAIASYERAIELKPGIAEAYSNRGSVLRDLRRLEEAVQSYDEAVACNPRLAEVHYNRGNVLKDLGRPEEAVTCYDRAIELEPDMAEAYANRGIALQGLARLDEAVAGYDRAIALRPDFAEALNNRGVALRDLWRFDEALESCDRAIALAPDKAEALSNRGKILRDLGRFDLAHESYERALAVRPDFPEAFDAWIEVKRRLCDWSDEGEHEWKVRIRSGLLSLASPAEHLAFARQMAAQFDAPPASYPPAAPRSGGRIRLGYLSADLRTHPVAFLIAGLIERHDRRRFEVLGYSCGPDDGSAIRARLTGAFDHFVDLQAASHRQAAERIHADAVDILVDMTGYTEHSRTAILAHRPAPIQVNYLGYWGTTGTDFIDYIIVDRFLVPADQQPFFSERLVHLPNCYQPCEIIQEVAERTPSRAECGLPEQGFVFCCFNNVLKITPELFDIWMRLLAAVPGSVLWLVATTPRVKDNLRREAIDRRVAADRLVFAAPTPRPEYLARLGLADLFLDTLPYNAGATASDALWAGLPVLTCSGDTYVGRMAGAVLTAAGLPELITTSLKGYESLAIRLATEPGLLARLRQRLACNRSIMPLFNIARFTRDLEAAYRQMHETWQAGRPPSAFAVSATADN